MNIQYLIGMTPQQGSGGGGMFSTLIMFGLIIVIFYFMILRPQQKKQKDRQQVLDSVKKGDRIVTIGGLHGTVVGVEEKTIIVLVAENVKMKFERSAVSSVTNANETGNTGS